MGHGGPDWGTAGPLATVYTLDDLAELAARLGSIVTFDRRGNVIWMDDFEHSLNKWAISLTGAGGSVAITNEKARTGALSCKVVTGDETNDYAHIIHREPYPVLSRLGLEFSLLTTEEKAVLYFIFTIYTGTYRHSAGIKYDLETHAWQYRTSAGPWAALPTTAKLTQSSYLFHTLKLVIDTTTHYYVRFIGDNVAYDMSALAYRYGADPTDPQIEIGLSFYPTEDASKTIYYDDVILTQNEP